MSTSFKNRLRRLERLAANPTMTIAQQLQAARARRDAMSPAERAAAALQRIDESLEMLAAAGGALPAGSGIEDRFARIRHRVAARHLAAMAALDAPDLPAPAEGDLSPDNVQRMWAWSELQHLRSDARRYLAQVEEARGLYTPRHWPLSAELINLARPRAHQENAHGAA